MNNDLMFSSKDNTWATPQDFFDRLNNEFNFTLDPCASDANHKCEKYFTEEDNGLLQSWEGETVFMNPPYGRGIKDWVKKAYDESLKCQVVALIPSRTDTRYWHDYIWDEITESPRAGVFIRFIKGRLKFGGAKNCAPFPSAVIIFARGGK